MQDSITVKIVDALQFKLAPAGRAALARGVRTRDTVAYNLYLEARRATQNGAQPGLERARALLDRALQLDSLFADAWVGLYDVLYFQYGYGGAPPLESAVARRRAVERAIELDSLNGYAFAARGDLRSAYDWDWDGAWRDMRRAVHLSPASADAASTYAAFLNLVNEPDSALAHMRRAVALDPTSPFMWTILGNMFAFAAMHDSAIAASQHALKLDSTLIYPYWVQMHGYLDLGRRADADSAAEQMRRPAGEDPGALAFVSGYYRRTGNRAGAQEILDRLTALARHRYVPPSIVGAARLAAGDHAGALDALEEAALTRDFDLVMRLVLSYSPLKGDPRYEAVARKVFGGRPVPRNPFP
jgi:tetratricopeptide (TPR) repeat protein